MVFFALFAYTASWGMGYRNIRQIKLKRIILYEVNPKYWTKKVNILEVK